MLVAKVFRTMVHVGATAFHVPDVERSTHLVTYYIGYGSPIVALFSAIVGVPVVARLYHVGFWRGLLAVMLALGWLALSFLPLFSRLAPFPLFLPGLTFETILLAAIIINFAGAVLCAVILYLRRRAKRLEAQRIRDAFS